MLFNFFLVDQFFVPGQKILLAAAGIFHAHRQGSLPDYRNRQIALLASPILFPGSLVGASANVKTMAHELLSPLNDLHVAHHGFFNLVGIVRTDERPNQHLARQISHLA